jgi:hypothetical protein
MLCFAGIELNLLQTAYDNKCYLQGIRIKSK